MPLCRSHADKRVAHDQSRGSACDQFAGTEGERSVVADGDTGAADQYHRPLQAPAKSIKCRVISAWHAYERTGDVSRFRVHMLAGVIFFAVWFGEIMELMLPEVI